MLSEVILVAQSASALQIARSSPDQVQKWFTDKSPFIRKGSTNSFSPDVPKSNGHTQETAEAPFNYDYTVIMTEPVLQGIARANHTRFIVTSAEGDIENVPSSELFDSTSLRTVIPSEPDDSDYSDLEGFEIDEGFLANSILGPLSNGQTRTGSNGDLSSELVEGELAETPAIATFTPHPLDASLRNEPSGANNIDSEARVFVRTADLGRVGVFNGDWVLAIYLCRF